MNSSLKERFERLGPVEDVSRGQSGSPVAISLHFDQPVKGFRSISAVRALVKGGMSMLTAKKAIERAMEKGQVTMLVPHVESQADLARELEKTGLVVKAVAVRPIDVREIRQKIGLTQEQFALRFGIDLETLRNWEQGKRSPDKTAQSYLRAIERMPEEIQAAQEDPILKF
ncbi:helix-turn-helix domain-containing protein [Rhizobium sp. LEGMi12c]|uniref:Helix-turn-helix n=2 Tax=Rhizobium hainanense TaxID=52131 RepID=A0A1C3U632_9HYPH|nr:Helix-turn-helix [Rhizobium hainanense]